MHRARSCGLLLLIVCMAAPSWAAIRVGRLKYGGGGDWYANPSAVPNLLRFARQQTTLDLPEQPEIIDLQSDKLFDVPILFATGHGRIAFTAEESGRLRRYLLQGGFLHVDDNYGLDETMIAFTAEESGRLRRYLLQGGFLHVDDNYGLDETFRPALKQVFPDRSLVQLPFSHPLYHGLFDFPRGLPKIHEHHGGPPRGYGLLHENRVVLFYSYNTDLSDGWESPEVHKDPPERRLAALRMGVNILVYALTH